MQVNILLLEDDPHDAELIRHQLESSGLSFAYRHADSRESFTNALRSFRPHLILSDFSMPGFDGMAALTIAREEYPEVPFIFVSGTIGEEKAIEAIKNGATDYVLKDRPARLVPSVRRALQDAEARAALKRAEQAERDTQVLFRLIMENVADLIAVLDLNGRRLYNNRAYAPILGDPETLQGTDSFREIHPDDRERIRQVFFTTVNTGVGHRAEFRFMARDGSIRFIESQGSVIRDTEGKVSKVVVVSRDVTDRKQAEAEKESLEKQFRQAQKMESIGTLAGGVAHDFNNILAIILGYGSLLEKQSSSPEELKKALANINQAARRGSAVVRQLMTFARKSEVVFAPTQINIIVNELVDMLRATVPKTITLAADLAPQLPTLTADAAQLNQALLNLCVNARDAMPQGGTLTISTGLTDGDHIAAKFHEAEKIPYVVVRVRDTGVGMDEETRQRMFEPFFTTKQAGRGTGLGLSMVYGVIKDHKGFIDADSEPGRGTTFQIYLPVKRKGVSPAAVKARQRPTQRGEGTILLVEDEELLIELVRALLTEEGYTVLVARTGPEAVSTFRDRKAEIDLVVSDLGLPELSGIEVMRRIRAIAPGVKAVFVTGFIEEEERQAIEELGVRHLIQKPFTQEELLNAIRDTLEPSSP